MKRNQRLYDVLRSCGHDMAVLCLPENVVHASGMVTLPNIYAVGFFNWSLPLATAIINVRDEKEVLYIADSVEGDVPKYSFFEEVRTYHPYDMYQQMNPPEEFQKGFEDAIAEVGFDGADIAVEPNIPRAALQAIERVLPGAKFSDASCAIFKSKMVKAQWEIDRMKKAAGVIDAAFCKLNSLSHLSGLSELEMWKEVFGAMVDQAGGHVQISGELVTGPGSMNSSYPGGPTGRITRPGDVGLMDMSARYEGYWCDCCNVVSFGGKNKNQLKYFEIVRNAFEYTKAALKPGATASQVFYEAQKAYTEAGFECPHYIGHSIGTGLNDLPKIIPCDNTFIEEGMCFSMEPGIYQENMGLRIEKMLYVTKDGCEEFNSFRWGVYEWD